MDQLLIAPCGMNCGVCSAYLSFTHDVRSKGIRTPYCVGCRPRNKQCSFLKKRCERLSKGTIKYCYECVEFPCERLRQLDRRYRTFFKMSLIENLETIRRHGIAHLLMEQIARWKCPGCGGVICCHNGICYDCGLDRLRTKKNLYRWDG